MRSTPRGDLGPRQQKIIDFIASTVQDRGYPPSVREIAEAVGLTSPSTVHNHLEALQRKGYIVKDATKPRAIEVRYAPEVGRVATRGAARQVPLLGRVAAGIPTLAQENFEETMPLPAQLLGEGSFFMLKVSGESMVEAGIHDGDYVVVRQQQEASPGDIVVARVDDDATVKTLARAGSGGKLVLRPENKTMQPIPVTEATAILGKVVALLRSY